MHPFAIRRRAHAGGCGCASIGVAGTAGVSGIGEQVSDLVKVQILLQGESVDAFSAIVHKDKAYAYGVMMAGKLKDLIPRQQFEVPIQAAIGPDHRAGDDPGDPQGRARQVLRR